MPAFAIAISALHHAYAQDDYPSRPIRLVVPVAAGGGTDMVGRVLAEHLSSKLGQPVTVENRPGAGSLIGIDSVAKSAADGYTLILALSDGFTIMPSMKKDVPYDPVKSFTLIGLAARTPFSYSVSNEVPAKNLRELVDHAKKNPGKLKWAVSGSYSTSDLATELLKVTQGLEFVSVPYRGGCAGDRRCRLRAGRRIDGQPAARRATGLDRKAEDPGADGTEARRDDSRTSRLRWNPASTDLVVVAWFGLAGPAKLPPAVTAKLANALATFHGDASVNQRFAAAGIETAAMPAAEFSAYITSELAKWRDVVVKAGIPIQ